jgi:hypothetical protein
MTLVLAVALLIALRLVAVMLFSKSKFEPLSVSALIKKLVTGLPPGTFMVS